MQLRIHHPLNVAHAINHEAHISFHSNQNHSVSIERDSTDRVSVRQHKDIVQYLYKIFT